MKIFLILLSIGGLTLTIIPSLLVFLQEISLAEHKQWMFVGMLLWFFTSPFWMKEQEL